MNPKYEKVYGYGAVFIVCLIAMLYLLIKACATQTDSLHYFLVFGFFASLLTCAFAYQTQVAWKEAHIHNLSIEQYNERIKNEGLPLENEKLF